MKRWRVAWAALWERAPFLRAPRLSPMERVPSTSIAWPEPVSWHRAALFIPMELATFLAKPAVLVNAHEPVAPRLRILLRIAHPIFATFP